MKSLNADRLSNFFQSLDPKACLTLSKVSPTWSDFMEQICFSEIKSFENVNLVALQESDCEPPLLMYREGLDLIDRVAPHLTSLTIRPHFAGECGYLLFGSQLYKMNNFDLSNLFQIVYEKCVNLEEVFIDTHRFSSALMAKMVENNPKLKVLNMVQNAISDIFPTGATIPTLEEIFLYGSYEQIKGFSSLSEQLVLIDMTYCFITPEELPELVQEILQHKESLLRLRINLIVSHSEDPDCSALAALATCTSLRELKIYVEDGELVPGNFVKDIIKSCTSLEFVRLKNVDIDEETYNELITLPKLEDAHID